MKIELMLIFINSFDNDVEAFWTYEDFVCTVQSLWNITEHPDTGDSFPIYDLKFTYGEAQAYYPDMAFYGDEEIPTNGISLWIEGDDIGICNHLLSLKGIYDFKKAFVSHPITHD